MKLHSQSISVFLAAMTWSATQADDVLDRWANVGRDYSEFRASLHVSFHWKHDSGTSTVADQRVDVIFKGDDTFALHQEGTGFDIGSLGTEPINCRRIARDGRLEALDFPTRGCNYGTYRITPDAQPPRMLMFIEPLVVLFRPTRVGSVGFFEPNSLARFPQDAARPLVDYRGVAASNSNRKEQFGATISGGPDRTIEQLRSIKSNGELGVMRYRYFYRGSNPSRSNLTGYVAEQMDADGKVVVSATVTDFRLELRQIREDELEMPVIPRAFVRIQDPDRTMSISDGKGRFVPTTARATSESTPEEILSDFEAKVSRRRLWSIFGIIGTAIALAFTVRLARRNRLARGTP